MKIIPFGKSLPITLPLYEVLSLAEACSKSNEEFLLIVGMNQEQVQRLKELSLDETDTALRENTSDHQRFGQGSYEEWYAQSRTIFSLIHKDTGDLAAITWFGPKPLGKKSLKHVVGQEAILEQDVQDNWHTISYRCYPRFRGQGIMKPFVAFCLDAYSQEFPQAKFWAGMHSANAASDGLALSLGFEPCQAASDAAACWQVMTRE
jgi:RimJ/RimL family protein N-acetyltransferase